MAMALKRQNGLMSVRVKLAFWANEPRVTVSFEHKAKSVKHWDFASEEVGIPAYADRTIVPELNLPAKILATIRALADKRADSNSLEPLWLHLSPPYGYAGLLPWEQVLGDATGRSILRLPDFLERTREDPRTLVMAIVYDPSAVGLERSDPETQQSAHRRVAKLIDAALAVPREQVTIHLFTTVDAELLLPGWDDRRVHVHRPANAPGGRNFAGGGSLWFDWIIHSLGGYPLDAIHFVCGADMGRQAAALSLRDSLSPDAGYATLSSIAPSELTAFMTRAGAWAAMFSPVPGTTGTDIPWRYFADCLALLRPGPSLLVGLEEDKRTSLRELYAFLFSPHPTFPPLLGPNFLYCQPALVAAYGESEAEVPSLGSTSILRSIDQFGQSVGLSVPLPEQPGWASTAQRYVEKSMMEVNRLRRSLGEGSLDGARHDTVAATSEAMSNTLEEIQHIIDRQTKLATGGE